MFQPASSTRPSPSGSSSEFTTRAPFTGVGIREKDDTITETPYRDGAVHGRVITRHRSGVILHDYQMVSGAFAGDYYAYYLDGSPRWHRYFGGHTNFRERQWNEAGVLVSERDDQRRESRRWYDDGTLRSERVGDTTRWWTPDGHLWLTVTRAKGKSDTCQFDEARLEERLLWALADPLITHYAMSFLYGLVRTERARALRPLRQVLERPATVSKLNVIRLIGEHKILELQDDLERLTTEEITPPRQLVGFAVQHPTESFAQAAKTALTRMQ